jgi:hypothetical protein
MANLLDVLDGDDHRPLSAFAARTGRQPQCHHWVVEFIVIEREHLQFDFTRFLMRETNVVIGGKIEIRKCDTDTQVMTARLHSTTFQLKRHCDKTPSSQDWFGDVPRSRALS